MFNDNVTPAERMRPFARSLPWRWIAVAALIAVYAIVQDISDWGEREPLVSWAIERSCGL